MKRLIAILVCGFGVSYGFIPSVSVDTLLKLYPWPHGGLQITASACTLNILQDTIWIAIGNTDSITWTAARVCSSEIYKNFYFAIDTTPGKNDPTRPIKEIKIQPMNSLPSDTVVFAFGKRNDPLINSISGINNLIPNKTEGYVLKEMVQNKKLIIVGAGYDLQGTFHSASTLRELIAQNSRGVVPTTMLIQDYPDILWREVGWQGSELGARISDTTGWKKQTEKLDYLSLLKCNLVEHEAHRGYFLPPDNAPPNPFLWNYPADYTNRITANRLNDIWYPRYWYQGIEPVPYYMNYEECYDHILMRDANCIAGTGISDQPFKVVIESGDTIAKPEYKIPKLKNPCFDSTVLSSGVPSGWYPWGTDPPTATVESLPSEAKSGEYVCKLVFPRGGATKGLGQLLPVAESTFYVFKYWIKSEIPTVDTSLRKDNGVYMRVQGKDSVWHLLAVSQGQDSAYGKWVYRIQDSCDCWRDKEFTVGFFTEDCDSVIIDFMATLPASAPWDSITVYIDGDTVMMQRDSLRCCYSNQQRFLIKTDSAGPIVKKWDGSLLTENTHYSIQHYNLWYTWPWSKGFMNDSCGPWKLKILGGSVSPGSKIKVSYSRVGYGDFNSPNASKVNYSPCPLESKTKTLVDTTIGLMYGNNSLKPLYVDPCYNEPVQGSLTRDGRAKKKGWKADSLIGMDVNYYYQKLRSYNAHNGQKPRMVVFADWMTKYHQGWMPDSILDPVWKARQVINHSYRDSIIPLIWGMRSGEPSYTALRDTLQKTVEDLRSDDYTPVLWPFTGDKTRNIRWLKAMEYLKDSTEASVRGYYVNPGGVSEGQWNSDTLSHLNWWATVPIAMDLAWNLDPDRFIWVSVESLGAEPVDVRLYYSPEILHLNKGDIFSPPVANFKAVTIDSNDITMVRLTWSPNLNKDWGSYRIEKYDWPKKKNNCQGSWQPLPSIIGRTNTIYTDTSPIWGRDGMCPKLQVIEFPTVYARYRISAYDNMANQSPFDSAQASWKMQPPKSPFGGTGYSGQTKVIDPWGTFHLTYSGGIEDTVVYYQKLILIDTIVSIIDTVGIGKFPTLVLKPGTVGDTLAVAYLSKHSDTIYYRCRKGTVWDSPVVLYSGAQFSLSVPRMALDTCDTVHITFLKRSGDILILNYGKFSLCDSTLTVQPVSNWTTADSSVPIDSLGAAVAIDFNQRPYLAWIENDTIKYAIGLAGGFLKKTLSATTGTKRSVCASASLFNIEIGWTDGNNLIRSYWYATDTAEVFRDTVYSGSEPKNATAQGSIVAFEHAGDVFVKSWDAVNRTWSVPETLSVDTLPASYPQIEAEQFIDSTNNISPARFALWTQMTGDSLYELGGNIKSYENQGEYGITPYAYLKMGKARPTPFTVHRDAFHYFGSEDYKQIDFGRDSLVYLLPSLEPGAKYRIFTEFYFDTTAPNGYKAKLTVNGITIRNSITITPRQLLRLNDFLPANIGAMGYLRIKLSNLQGSY